MRDDRAPHDSGDGEGLAARQGASPPEPDPADPKSARLGPVAFTVFTSPGRLSKRFEQGPDESIAKESSVLFFSGTAHRVEYNARTATEALVGLRDHIQELTSRQAIGLGVAKNGLVDNDIVTVREKRKGRAGIARSLEDFDWPDGPGLILIDGDGVVGLRERLIALWPAFKRIAMLERPSSSAGIQHSGTGETYPDAGEHLYLIVDNIARSKEALDALMRLAWRKGQGRLAVSACGALLVRGPVDVAVGSPERLVYEGAVEVVSPIEATDPRVPVIHPGAVLPVADVLAYADREASVDCFEELKREAAQNPDLMARQRAAHTAWLERRTADKIKAGVKPKIAEQEAEAERKAFKPGVVHAQLRVTLSANDVFATDDGRTIRLQEVLDNPSKFNGITGPDPGDGPDSQRGKAMIMGLTENGQPFIHSFAHGGIIYEIKPNAPKSDPLPILDLAALDGVAPPDRTWLVTDLLHLNEVSLLTGHGGTGKSRLLLQLAVATVLRRAWLNHMVDHSGPALIVCCEDDQAELHRRLNAIARHYGVSFTELAKAGLTVMSFAGRDATLAEPDRKGILRPTALFHQISDAIRDLKPRLSGFDNAADVYGGEENARRMVRQFITMLRGVAIENNTHNVLTLHPSLTGMNTGTGLSGSTGWFNSVRAQLYLKSAEADDGVAADPDRRVLQNLKNQNERLATDTMLRWNDGVFIPEHGPTGFHKAAAEQKVDDLFMTLLTRFAQQNRDVSDKKSPSYAPAVFAAEADAHGTSSKAFADAMSRLFNADRIHVEPTGSPSKRRSRLCPGPDLMSVF